MITRDNVSSLTIEQIRAFGSTLRAQGYLLSEPGYLVIQELLNRLSNGEQS